MERTRCFVLDGKKYRVTMSYVPLVSLNNKLRQASREEKDLLEKLIVALNHRNKDSDRGYLSSEVSTVGVQTLVSLPDKRNPSNKTYYRIDNQIACNMTGPYVAKGPGPKINLQYQVGTESVAEVLIYMKPYRCPAQFKDELLDHPVYGFSEGQVMRFVDLAFKSSAEEKQYFVIGWTIEEIGDVKSSGSRSESLERSKTVDIPKAEREKKGTEMANEVKKKEVPGKPQTREL